MFHLKFRRVLEEGVAETNISCPHYESWLINPQPDQSLNHSDVAVYKDFTGKDGVEYHVGGPRENAYDVCFVTNDAGKTIDRIGPFNDPKEAA